MSPRSAEALRLVAEAANGAPRAHQGACTCSSPKWADCECGWGELIDSLLRLAYSEQTTHVALARELPAVVALLRNAAASALSRAMRSIPGTPSAVARLVGVSAERVKQVRRRTDA